MLRILVVTSEYPTARRPIQGAIVSDHIRAASRNHQVLVLHVDRANLERDRPTGGGPPAVRTTFPRVGGKIGQLVAIAVFPFLLARTLLRHRFRPDVVHGHFHLVLPHAWLTARLTRARWIHTEHSSGFEYCRINSLQLQIARRLYPRADAALAVSRHLADTLDRLEVYARWQVVWNAIDTDLFAPDGQPRPGGRARFLAVGRLDSDDKKNIGGLLSALGALRDRQWALTIIGDGPARRRLEEAAGQLGIADRVTFTGQQPRTDVAEAMRTHDRLVHPSPVETFSAVVAEACATGLPVIAARTGAIPELVELAGAGELIDGHEGLVAALVAAIENPRLHDPQAMAEAVVGRLALDRLADDLDDVYRPAESIR